MRLFDELGTSQSILSIDEYFNEMDLTEIEKKKRKAFAEDMQEAMLFIFALFSIMKQYNRINKEFIISQLQSRYSEIVLQRMDIDKYLENYISNFCEETVDVTLRHIDEPFYLSDDRSLLIATNEGNSIFNYQEFSEAVKSGKTRKRWITERDNKVRKTHAEVNGITIPINEPFVVGNSLMMFAKDVSLGASMEEIANCRCAVLYL